MTQEEIINFLRAHKQEMHERFGVVRIVSSGAMHAVKPGKILILMSQ